MFSRNKALFIILIIAAVVFAANHAEYAIRSSREKKNAASGNNIIVSREGSYLGHDTIGINEANLPSSGENSFLRFSLLEKWNYDRQKNTPCPPEIKELEGKSFNCAGFMYPLESGSDIKTFCLLRSTQTCCYGPRPQYNQYILVEMEKPARFERLAPVVVEGRFFVDPKPEEGYIYRMEAHSIVKETGADITINPAEAARKAGLPLFDFNDMKKLQSARDGKIPDSILALENKSVVVEGFVAGRTQKTPPTVVIGSVSAQTAPPTAYNAVMVFPEKAEEMPPVWKDRDIYTGTLKINTDPVLFKDKGIIRLENAYRGVKKPSYFKFFNASGPIIPVSDEILVFSLIIFAFFIKLMAGKRTNKLPPAAIVLTGITAILLLSGCDGGKSSGLSLPSKKIQNSGSGNDGNQAILAPALDDGRLIKEKRKAEIKLLKKFLDKEKIIVTPEAVNQEVEKMRKNPPQAGCICCRYPTLGDYMKANYMDLDELKELVRAKLGFRLYLNREWEKHISPPGTADKIVRDSKDEITKDYVRVSHIFFNTFQSSSPDQDYDMLVKEKRELSVQIYARLKKGEAFDELAVKNSDDAIAAPTKGDLGCIPSSTFGPSVQQLLKKMKPGEISEPVESAWGFHIFRKEKISDQDILETKKDEYINTLAEITVEKVKSEISQPQ